MVTGVLNVTDEFIQTLESERINILNFIKNLI